MIVGAKMCSWRERMNFVIHVVLSPRTREREREYWGEPISKKGLLRTVNNILAVACFCSPFSLVSSNRAMISKSLQSLHLSSASQSVPVLRGIMELKSWGSILEMKECQIAECIPCQCSAASCYVFNCQLWHRCCWGSAMPLELGWSTNSVIFLHLLRAEENMTSEYQENMRIKEKSRNSSSIEHNAI